MGSVPSKDSKRTLPEFLDITLEEFEKYYDDWTMWRALEKRFLPVTGGFRQQPKHMMEVILKIDDIFETILEQDRETS